MSDPKPRSAYSRAEQSSRRLTLLAGAGFISFILGSITTAGLVNRFGPLIADSESETFVLVVTGLLQSVWVVAFLPLSGWLAGRFLGVSPWRFTLPAAVTGLAFDVLLTSAVFGAESLFAGWPEAALSAVLIATGVGLTLLAVREGLRAYEATLAQALAVAEANRPAYKAFTNANEPPKTD